MSNNRRNRMDLMHPAEKKLVEAVWEVEKLGASQELTDLVLRLQAIKDKISDMIDLQEGNKNVSTETT